MGSQQKKPRSEDLFFEHFMSLYCKFGEKIRWYTYRMCSMENWHSVKWSLARFILSCSLPVYLCAHGYTEKLPTKIDLYSVISGLTSIRKNCACLLFVWAHFSWLNLCAELVFALPASVEGLSRLLEWMALAARWNQREKNGVGVVFIVLENHVIRLSIWVMRVEGQFLKMLWSVVEVLLELTFIN